ncbi:MAG: 2Fe-2S iron-sulfur cluster binding domain-containing protein [Gammaproteobacteria bacterium]|nr:2Fe-2S iron-sulfur cluster binding domain-containing protein [Gammaproteobacteria bacterium]
MPVVVYRQPDGVEKEIEVRLGQSLMEAAVQNNVDGIEAECGGSCMCATCHIYVDEAFLDKLLPVDELEDEMLESTHSERRANSRLSCQLLMTEALDGMHVELPPSQS